MKITNNVPPFAEEIKIDQPTAEQVIQEILNREKFKQPVSTNFIKLKVEEGNYMGSTNPKWKDKRPCERYGFSKEKDNNPLEKEWIQIDITHELMELLEIEPGEDITYPLYLSPEVFNLEKKKPIRGAITIEKEEEIFIDKPVSEKSAERELEKRLKELVSLREKLKILEKNEKVSKETITNLQKKITDLEENKESLEKKIGEKIQELGDKSREVADLNIELTNKDQELTDLLTQLTQKDNQIIDLTHQINSLQTSYNGLNNQLITTQVELIKEKGWWDKWFSEPKGIILWHASVLSKLIEGHASVTCDKKINSFNELKFVKDGELLREENYSQNGRKIIKFIYEYYKNK